MKNLLKKLSLKKGKLLLRPTTLTGNGVVKLNEFLFPGYNPLNLIKREVSKIAYFDPKVSHEYTDNITRVVLKEFQLWNR